MINGKVKSHFNMIIYFFIFALILTGCSSNRDNSEDKIPRHFNDIIMGLDKSLEQRDSYYEGGNIYRAYIKNDGSYLFVVKSNGYKEDMLLSVAMNKKSITEVNVLYENESEDYGEYVTNKWFLDRFKLGFADELKLVKRKKDSNNEIIAITGATITSKGVVDGVNECIKKLLEK